MTATPQWLSRGLWSENPVLVHLLGLCPLLAVTTTVVNALLLGLATLAVLVATNTVVSILRHAFVTSVRIPLFVLIIASFVTSVDLLIDAWFHDLHRLVGLFIPLIVTNCTILAQAETVASRQGIAVAARSALGVGSGFLAVLLALGAIREIFGRGTLFSGFEMLIGEPGALLEVDLPFDGALAFVLAPGAFLGLAALLAVRNAVTTKAANDPEAAHEN
ncbi:MAG: electron transport complex subunit RsxE [Gammaproteobacteria bacterium]|jgi:electron transport complex protein RnfE